MTARIVAHFELQSLLGEGGIGRVYSALDTELGRMVALKALRPELSHDAGFVGRFRAEASNLARLAHPNITTLFSMQRDGSDLYMVMELVEGRTLEDVLTALGPLQIEQVQAVAAQVAAGLGYAHRMGVIHRDLKPSNLMLTDSGEIKIMDFGIARMRGSQRMTRAGSIVGTLAYMPPEQIKGSDNDERSDIYSLACVLHELLSGHPPFSAETEYDLIQAQMNQPAASLRAARPDIDPAMDTALLRALSKQPAERPASAAEFARALGASTLTRPAADILQDALVARLGPRPQSKPLDEAQAKPTSGGASTQGKPASVKPAKTKSESNAPSSLKTSQDQQPRRLPLPLPALVLGGAALLVVLGFVGITLLAPQPAPPISTSQTAGNSQPATSQSPTSQSQTSEFQTSESGASTAPQAPDQSQTAANTSSSIFAAPDHDSTLALAKPGATELPACPPPGGDTSQVVSGHVDALAPDGSPQIAGKTVPLFGVQTVDASRQPQLSDWLASKGGALVCCPTASGRYRCKTDSSKQDVAELELMNGLARSADGAPQVYVQFEQYARDRHSGVWQ